jgi:hypothetical protein
MGGIVMKNRNMFKNAQKVLFYYLFVMLSLSVLAGCSGGDGAGITKASLAVAAAESKQAVDTIADAIKNGNIAKANENVLKKAQARHTAMHKGATPELRQWFADSLKNAQVESISPDGEIVTYKLTFTTPDGQTRNSWFRMAKDADGKWKLTGL